MYGYVWNGPIKFTDPTGLGGWGSDTADWLDQRIEYARLYYQGDVQNWVLNGTVNTVADLASGYTDLLRVGNGTAQAIYCEDTVYGQAAFIATDVLRASGIFATLAGPIAGRSFGRINGTAVDVPASTPVGRSRNPISVGTKGEPAINAPGEVYGRPYSGHAFDRIQGRGIPPSAVENTIQNGVPSPGNVPGRSVYYEQTNNLTVVIDSNNGTVITVRQGRP